MNENNTFKDDIERAEQVALLFSWVVTVTALSLIGFAAWGI